MLSAVVITFMEEARIADCLKSLQFCDDIVVVDSFSTDKTCDIAERCGARVIQKEWLGFGPQKQFAIEQAKHDWVLCLDADEVVTAELQASILGVLKSPDHCAYEMPRRNFFLGRFLRHGEGYPDWSLRLFDRRSARWSDDTVHEKVITNQSVGKLSGDLEHRSADSLHKYLDNQNRYTSLQAEKLIAQGKQVSLAKILLSPSIRFLKFYFIRRGFLDGFAGFIHIWIGCMNSFIKYAKVREATGHKKLTNSGK